MMTFPSVSRGRSSNETKSSFSLSVCSYIVIGNGPIGASVAKHLIASLVTNTRASVAEGREQKEIVVTIVDGNPLGIGSSHSDRARLIRTFDAEGDVFWTRWNRRSLEAFPKIERLWNEAGYVDHNNQSIYSGGNGERIGGKKKETNPRKSFFTRCGALLLGDEKFVARSKKAADDSLASTSPSSFSLISPAECRRKWPYLNPKPGCDVAMFDPSGGIIDPHAFIEAQNDVAASMCSGIGMSYNGQEDPAIRLEIQPGVAAKLRNGGRTVELASGKILTATEKIILCGGAYSGSLLRDSGIGNGSDTGEEKPRASKRTVALLEVDPASVLRNAMPTIKYAFGLSEQQHQGQQQKGQATTGEHSRVEAGSVYLLPPVLYPERGGKWFVKIGGGPNDYFGDEGSVASKRELDDWLSSEGDSSSAAWLAEIARSLLPELGARGWQSMACVTTTMATTNETDRTGLLVDDILGDGTLVAVSACQGKGAGPSDAIAADIVRNLLEPGRPHGPRN